MSTIQEVAARLRYAQRVLFITGAGISADSGLPTYRGVGGLYDDTLTSDGIPIEVALSGPMLAQHPEITWKHLHQIERHCRDATPNLAHLAIAEIERRLPFTLTFTQNIDGLHAQAGSQRLVEIHGNLHCLRCTRCQHTERVRSFDGLAATPHCPHCGALVRPDVVLFGEALAEEKLARLYEALDEGLDLLFSIGTSSRFPYISAPVAWARRHRVPVVEINPDETAVSALADFAIRDGAAATMGQIMDNMGW